jgi:hypothetical protein
MLRFRLEAVSPGIKLTLQGDGAAQAVAASMPLSRFIAAAGRSTRNDP